MQLATDEKVLELFPCFFLFMPVPFFSAAVSFAQQQEEGGSGGRSVAKQTTLLLGSPKKNYFFPFHEFVFPTK